MAVTPKPGTPSSTNLSNSSSKSKSSSKKISVVKTKTQRKNTAASSSAGTKRYAIDVNKQELGLELNSRQGMASGILPKM